MKIQIPLSHGKPTALQLQSPEIEEAQSYNTSASSQSILDNAMNRIIECTLGELKLLSKAKIGK